MVDEDPDLQELVNDFVTESREHLGNVETDLLGLESGEASPDTIHRLFRAVHSVKGVAGFLGFEGINRLAHTLESVLDLVRKERLGMSGDLVSLLLKSNDRLREMIEHVHESDAIAIGDLVDRLKAYLDGDANAPQRQTATPVPAGLLAPEEHLLEVECVPMAVALALDLPLEALPEHLGTLGRVVGGATGFCQTVAEGGSREAQSFRLATRYAAEEIAKRLGLDSAMVRVVDDGSGDLQPESNAVAAPAQEPVQPDHGSRTAKPAADVVEMVEKPTAPAAEVSEPVEAGKGKAEPAKAGGDSHSDTIRVSVGLLDRLMNLGGELVLSRNQLLQAHGAGNDKGVDFAATRLSQVVSEVQEAIMQTRMQPVASLFQRFPRVVRDLSGKLGKRAALEISGREVELDRSILEALSDPLTHLVRNALDHGLELPAERTAKGKQPEGRIVMSASQVGGNVRITIADDGRGMDPQKLKRKAVEKGILTATDAAAMSDREAVHLIFAAGFSTAEKVTDVSGRGVGMDVVRSNIEKLGGYVEVQSTLGHGSTIAITIPLTLAILPAMVLWVGTQRYVMSQANIAELVRLRAGDREQRLATMDGREVLRLRGEVLPLLKLGRVLGIPGEERPTSTIVVVETGNLRYGLAVDAPPDAEEIVVKPLGRHLKNRGEYAGATILGDGCVAMILDATGIAEAADLVGKENKLMGQEEAATDQADQADFVLFRNHPSDWFAVPLGLVDRIQRVESSKVQEIGGRLVQNEGDRVLPVLRLDTLVPARTPEIGDRVSVLVLRVHGRQVGVLAPMVEDIRSLNVRLDAQTLAQDGVLGSFQLQERTVRVLDVTGLARKGLPQLFADAARPAPVAAAPAGATAATTAVPAATGAGPVRVLFAEDTRFFRDHVTKTLRGAGFDVVACADGALAWEQFQAPGQTFDVVVTDVQMPNCDGLELTRRIRKSAHPTVPVVALTSLSSDEDTRRGADAGVDAYLVKLDDEALVQAVRQHSRSNS